MAFRCPVGRVRLLHRFWVAQVARPLLCWRGLLIRGADLQLREWVDLLHPFVRLRARRSA
jgi:hypothetical protein